MKCRSILLGAIALGCAFAIPARAQNNPAPGNPAPADSSKSDQKTTDRSMAPDAKDICKSLSKITDEAFDKNGFDGLVKHFVDADRTRISKNNLTKADWDKLNGRIEEIQKDWKLKYNQDFKIDQPEMVFNDQFRIVQGTIGEAQPAGATMNGDKMDPGLPDLTPGAESDKIAGGDVNREKGRKVAKVTFPAEHGMPALYVPLIREFPDTWRIDVPDQVDGQKLYDNLLKQLTAFDEHKDQWPTDVNDAYRAAAHHVLMAIMDVDRSGDMNPDNKTPDNMPGK